MQRRTFIKLATVAFMSFAGSPTFAAEFGTREEAIAIVHRVQAKMKADGVENTLKSITSKEFNDRDLYPYVYTFDGVARAHGVNAALVGQNLIEMKDPTGTPMIKNIVAMAQSPAPGWVDYKWPNPLTKKIDDKSAYVERSGDYAIGVGVYR
ncbi:MAG: histidine kinase [Hyphomicrobiales bacterium]|nr:histidine kinase [Hyphomicrobiales bacterium]